MPDKIRVDPLTQPCATCKWATFEMTQHNPPRINARKLGQCGWPLPPMLPVAACYMDIRRIYNNPHKVVIWATDTGCPVWEPREGK